MTLGHLAAYAASQGYTATRRRYGRLHMKLTREDIQIGLKGRAWARLKADGMLALETRPKWMNRINPKCVE